MIPSQLYSKEIISYIRYLILDEDAKDFYSLNEIHQTKLVSLTLKSFHFDINITLSSDTLFYMSRSLIKKDFDTDCELLKSLHNDAIEKFSCHLDDLIAQIYSDINHENMIDRGFISFKDSSNGEILWRKSL